MRRICFLQPSPKSVILSEGVAEGPATPPVSAHMVKDLLAADMRASYSVAPIHPCNIIQCCNNTGNTANSGVFG
jgi:hypothetical protein